MGEKCENKLSGIYTQDRRKRSIREGGGDMGGVDCFLYVSCGIRWTWHGEWR
jgi:hypothetical protein